MLVRSELLIGRPRHLGDYEVTPFARRIVFLTPFLAFSWVKPQGFQVIDPDGRIGLQRVHDWTGLILVGLIGLVASAIWRVLRMRSGVCRTRSENLAD